MWDGAVLLPSTRLLLKRREVAEVERVLQSQREVGTAPSPWVRPLPGGCSPGCGMPWDTSSRRARPRPFMGWRPCAPLGTLAWDDALSTQRSHRSFGRGWSAWSSAGSSWASGRISSGMSSSNSTSSSRCQGGGQDWAGHRGPADPVPTPQAAAARQERALRRVEEERARAAGQGAEAARLRQELTGLLQRREHLARRLRSLRGFGDYLQGVLARTEQVSTEVPILRSHPACP